MLEIKDLHTSYRGIRALRGVSLHVAAGEMVALIGANGAGKSTLLNSISGVVRRESGSIVFDGRDIGGDAPWNTARAGLLQVPEGRQVIAELSVRENLEIGRTALGRRSARYTLDDIHALFPVLAERAAQLAGSLSGGQQQMLAIGRALMGSPRLLLLDEPSLGLAPLVINQVFAALRKINEAGLTVLLVEQNARKALALTARAYVLDQGEIVHAGASQALAADPAIAAHYLGGAA
jgi:branched-chain amino acid transport system ATP-binding protein